MVSWPPGQEVKTLVRDQSSRMVYMYKISLAPIDNLKKNNYMNDYLHKVFHLNSDILSSPCME